MESSSVPGTYGSSPFNTIGTGTGWSAMANLVRELDEQKIQSYKDDIDTILVFAGLFSAVMTAFLVESYHNLSQDPTQVIIFLMQQLATQTHSYTINSGFLNSTAPPLPNLPEFTPTVNAVRVNVLWFASLTLSLVSASFSILVKQWLQEYLAGEYTSPQARVRIRHFRYPGLDDWKVFEIAAALPLVLQLSLALFFVGLCFFTADVHSSVGYTTLPLVAAWGFFFVAVSLAPALSPRCPYKTRLLMTTMKTLRLWILEVILWVKDGSLDRVKLFAELPGEWSYKLLAYSEEEAARSETNDIDIFIAVDSIQADEQLLKAMWDALQQTQPEISETCAFITKIIDHRLPSDRVSVPYISRMLDLKRLPRRTVATVTGMAVESLRKEIDRQLFGGAMTSIEWSPAMKGCLCILLSEMDGPVPDTVKQLFLLLFSDRLRYQALFEAINSLTPNADSFSHVLAWITPAIVLANGEDLLDIVTSLVKAHFCSEAEHNHKELIHVIADHPEIPSQHVGGIVSLVISIVKKDITAPNSSFASWTITCRLFILQLYHLLPPADLARAEIIEFFRLVITTWRHSSFLFTPIMAMYPGRSWTREECLRAREICIDVAATSNPDDLREIMDNFRAQARIYSKSSVFGADEHESTNGHWDRTDPLHACLVFLRLLKAVREKGTPLAEYISPIHKFWEAIDEGLQTVAGMPEVWKEDYYTSAIDCLQLVNEMDLSVSVDEDQETISEWATSFLAKDSLFPDSFIASIAKYLPEEAASVSYRIRRIRLLHDDASKYVEDDSEEDEEDDEKEEEEEEEEVDDEHAEENRRDNSERDHPLPNEAPTVEEDHSTLPPISSVAFSPAHTILHTEPESQESTDGVSPNEGIVGLDHRHLTEHNMVKVDETDKPPDSDKGTRTATYDDSTPLNVDADNPVG